jgi:hypothetical protein
MQNTILRPFKINYSSNFIVDSEQESYFPYSSERTNLQDTVK